jgi:fructose-1,6-bisphosphatase II
LAAVPSYYLEKIIVGPKAKGNIDIHAPVRENLRVVAAALRKSVKDLTITILDRPRHQFLIDEVRKLGARIRLISDGDVAAGIATCLSDSGVDMVMGIGGSTEGVLTAVAVKCLGGEIHSRIWPTDEAEKLKIITLAGEKELERVFTTEDLAKGNSMIFAATGVTDGDLVRGVRYNGSFATTNSIVMRMRTGTIRRIETFHNLNRKTIRSKQRQEEIPV